MDMNALIKMAVTQTALDTCELLLRLRPTAPAEEQPKIDELVLRLSTMASTL